MKNIILFAFVTLTALGSKADIARMVLTCDLADMNARPYHLFQIVVLGRSAEMAHKTLPFRTARIFVEIVRDNTLTTQTFTRLTPIPEEDAIGGGFRFSWDSNADGAWVTLTRPKTVQKEQGKVIVIKGDTLTGTIEFKGQSGPQQLHNGGIANVNCVTGAPRW